MKLRNILLTCCLALCGTLGTVSTVAYAVNQPILVQAAIPEGMYDAAESAVASKNWTALFNALQTVANKNFHTVGYDGLFDVYAKSDTLSGGKLKDWYSEVTNYTVSTKRCGNYDVEGDCWNREHSIPKSWWGGSKSNQGCDAYIVVPTDGKVNGMRSNNSFGEVGSASYTSKSGCKLGSSKLSGYSGTVFEPYDSVKGDFARASLYATVKWDTTKFRTSDGAKFFSTSRDQSGNFGLTSYAKDLLYRWHKLDPVDDFEIKRNDAIMNSDQGNRNPFVDHPEYVEYLWGKGEVEDYITLKTKSLQLKVNETATIEVESASGAITWSSSDASIASVDNGKVTTNKEGEVTITARVGSASATVNVKVSNNPVPPTPTPEEDHSGLIVPLVIVGASILVASAAIALFIIIGRKKKLF